MTPIKKYKIVHLFLHSLRYEQSTRTYNVRVYIFIYKLTPILCQWSMAAFWQHRTLQARQRAAAWERILMVHFMSFYVYIFKNCGKSTVFNLVCGKLFVFYVQIELVALPQQPKCTYSSHCHTHILQCPAPEPQHFRKGPSPSKDRCCRHGSEDKEFREWFEQFRQLSQPCQWRWR